MYDTAALEQNSDALTLIVTSQPQCNEPCTLFDTVNLTGNESSLKTA